MMMLFRTLVALAFATTALAAPLPLDRTAPISRDVSSQAQTIPMILSSNLRGVSDNADADSDASVVRQMSLSRRQSGRQGDNGVDISVGGKYTASAPDGAANWGSTSQSGYTNAATSTVDNEVHSGTASNFRGAITGQGSAYVNVDVRGGLENDGSSRVGGFETSGLGSTGADARVGLGSSDQ